MKYQVKKGLGATLSRKGVEFRVWAPFAHRVQLVSDYYETSGIDLNNENDGYWSCFIDEAEAGYNYLYLIDTANGPVYRNDPRARVLTAAEGGLSVVAASDFDWGDDVYMPVPKEKQVLYELHIGTFNRPDASTVGTFATAIEKLDYLVELGVNMIELMPVTTMATDNGWGYSTSHIFSVEPTYGGRHGLMEFVRAAHLRGIGVMLDIVYNHFSKTDLWQFDGWQENGRGGIYFYNDERGDTPWGARPDYGRPEVRQFFLDNIVMWLSEYRLDGLRLDSTIYMRNTIGKNDDPEHDIGDAWKLLGSMTSLGHKINPGALLVAEDCSVNSYLTKPVKEGGCGFDAQWGLNFPHSLRELAGLPVPFPVDFSYELTADYNGDCFQKILFADSHDTAANGQVRLNEAITPGNGESAEARQRTLVASCATLTAPGIPMLMQGQEFMQDGDFSDWKELEWDNTEQFGGIVLAHRHLIDLRCNLGRVSAGLAGHNTNLFHIDHTNNVFAYHRWDKGGPGDDTYVVLNFGDREIDQYSLWVPLGGTWRVRFNSSWSGYGTDASEAILTSVTTDNSQCITIPLKAHSAYIFSQDLG